MDYLTQYYKNRTVQLQEEVVRLTSLVEATNGYQAMINYFTQQYGTYALYLAAVAAGHVQGWWETVTPTDIIMTGVGIALPMAAVPFEAMGQDMQTGGREAWDMGGAIAAYSQAVRYARENGYPKPNRNDFIAAGSPTGTAMHNYFNTLYPNLGIEQIPGIIDYQLEYETMGPPAPTPATSTPSTVPQQNFGGHQQMG